MDFIQKVFFTTEFHVLYFIIGSFILMEPLWLLDFYFVFDLLYSMSGSFYTLWEPFKP